MVTEERDKFRNIVNEFKRPKNDDGVGDETANRTLIQVLERYSCFLFRALLCCFFFLIFSFYPLVLFVQELESSLSKKEGFIAELESSLRQQEETNNRQNDEIRLLNERLTNEARRIKSLERESDRLRSEVSLLESKVCANIFDGLLHWLIEL